MDRYKKGRGYTYGGFLYPKLIPKELRKIVIWNICKMDLIIIFFVFGLSFVVIPGIQPHEMILIAALMAFMALFKH